MGWIFSIVLAVFIIVMLIISQNNYKKGLARTAEEYAERERALEQEKIRRQTLAVEILDRLPVEDPDTSPLLHEPVYDCGTDLYMLPCEAPNFECDIPPDTNSPGRIRSYQEARELITSMAGCRPDPQRMAVIDGNRYLAVIWTDTPSEPGGYVWRVVRVGQQEWFCFSWSAGMRPSAAEEDPTFMVAELSQDPKLWPRLLEGTRGARESNREYRYSLRQCQHRRDG